MLARRSWGIRCQQEVRGRQTLMSSRKKREFVVRFVIGDATGARSSVWRIWKGRGKDDIYIAPRPIVPFVKGSLHASGLCYFSITSQRHTEMITAGSARENRALRRWRRVPTPDAGLVGVLQLLFPAEYLSKYGTPVEADTALIEAPKPGQAIVVDLIFGRGGRPLLQRNQLQIGEMALSTGEMFFIIAGLTDDFDAQGFQQHVQPLGEDTEPAFLDALPPDADPDNLRGAIMLPVLDDGVLRIVEIGPAYVA
jgi:hypothetical protein